ncbi:MAG TPA: kelch repeat-containing protein, partial [bacterium]|nr:kelch repeat-containing protein [bacterium]
MATPRDNVGAATGLDGRIYAIGGNISFGYLNLVEAYDPASNTWSSVASLTVPRIRTVGVADPEGRIYALGGDVAAGPSAEVYDPAHPDQGWKPIAAPPVSAVAADV